MKTTTSAVQQLNGWAERDIERNEELARSKDCKFKLCPSETAHLMWLVRLQTIFGLTYFARYNNGHKTTRASERLLVIWLIIYDVSLTVIILSIEYRLFRSGSYENLFQHSLKRSTMNFVFRMTGLCFLLDYVVVKVLTMHRGAEVIDIIMQMSQGFRMSPKSLARYRMIYVVIVSIVVMQTLSILLMFDGLYEFEHYSSTEIYLLNGLIIAGGLVFGVNKTCVCSLHLYTSMVLCEQIRGARHNLFQCPNYGRLLQLTIQWRDQLAQFNHELSHTVLLKTIFNGVILAGVVCSMDDRLRYEVMDYKAIVSLTFTFTVYFVDELVSCYASQMIFNSMKRLVQAIQELIALQCIERCDNDGASDRVKKPNEVTNISGAVNIDRPGCSFRQISHIEHRCLEQIIAMAPTFNFTVIDFFDLRNFTLLILLSNVLNYAVILIQTQ